jgi:hypothetical protein
MKNDIGPDGRVAVDRVVDRYMQLGHEARRGRPAVPAEYLLPDDTIELDGLALVIAGTKLSPTSIAFTFVGLDVFVYVADRHSVIRLLGMCEESHATEQFAAEAAHQQRVSMPSPWLTALGQGRN